MIFVEDNLIKIGGVVLPGIIKKFEVTGTAAVDEVEVEGLPVKPKQAVGYEDSKIKVDLILDATPNETLDNKIARIYSLFRKKGQEIPQPQSIVSKETAAASIDKVIFEKLTVTSDNKTDQKAVTIEFCEYIPIPITASSGAGSAGSAGSGNGTVSLTDPFQAYLANSRGSSPLTPAFDDVMIGPKVYERLDSYKISLPF